MRYAHAIPQPVGFGGCGPKGHWREMTRHGRPGPWGPGGWGGPGPGWGGPGGFGRRGGPRARRGDVRAALLVLLGEEPRNGYQLIQEIEERSGGVWRPSPGAVYPALSQLEDEGLVRAEEEDGKRRFRLTPEGEAYLEEHRDRLAAPWDAVAGGVRPGIFELRDLVGQVVGAVRQVAHAGTESQLDEAKKILAEARRALYRILAEGEPDDRPTDVGEV